MLSHNVEKTKRHNDTYKQLTREQVAWNSLKFAREQMIIWNVFSFSFSFFLSFFLISFHQEWHSFQGSTGIDNFPFYLKRRTGLQSDGDKLFRFVCKSGFGLV